VAIRRVDLLSSAVRPTFVVLASVLALGTAVYHSLTALDGRIDDRTKVVVTAHLVAGHPETDRVLYETARLVAENARAIARLEGVVDIATSRAPSRRRAAAVARPEAP
jgi:hypothetical protein